MNAKRSEFNRRSGRPLTKECCVRMAFCSESLVYTVDCHSGQFHDPYIVRIQVAGILAKLKLDAVTGCLWFCDVVEDTDA